MDLKDHQSFHLLISSKDHKLQKVQSSIITIIMNSSRESKRAEAIQKKLRRLRSVTKSTSVDETSIIIDATSYIEDLKGKVNTLKQEIATSSGQHSFPMDVNVKPLEGAYLINIFCERNCPGLLVSILEAFDEIGLDVLDANVSCTDRFHLEAIGGQIEGPDDNKMNDQVVREAIHQAIRTWGGSTEED